MTAGLNGLKKVGQSGVLVFIEQALRVGIQVVLLVVGFRLGGALAGYGVALFIVTLLGIVLYDTSISIPRRRDVSSLISYARYSWLGSMKSKVSGPSIDVIILNVFVASSLIGIYQVSWNIASMLVMVSGSIQSTLFPEISELAADGEFERVRTLLEEGIVFTGMFAIPGFFGALLVGPRVLGFYGSEFAQGGTILLILIVARTVSSYSSQFTSAINGVDRPDLAFRVNLLLIVSKVVLNLVLIPTIGWYGAAIATAASTALTLVLGYYYLLDLIGGVKIPVIEITKQIVSSGVMVMVIAAVLPYVPRFNHVATVGVVFLGAGAYVAVLIVLSGYLRRKLRSIIPHRLPLSAD